MTDGNDLDAMIRRFGERAEAVKRRQIPPVEGEQRKAFVEQSRIDYQDYAMIGDATATLEDGVIVLRIDPRS